MIYVRPILSSEDLNKRVDPNKRAARKFNKRGNTKNHINISFSGAVLSLVLFKRKSWPMVFGLGSGFGMAYTNCEQEINKK